MSDVSTWKETFALYVLIVVWPIYWQAVIFAEWAMSSASQSKHINLIWMNQTEYFFFFWHWNQISTSTCSYWSPVALILSYQLHPSKTDKWGHLPLKTVFKEPCSFLRVKICSCKNITYYIPLYHHSTSDWLIFRKHLKGLWCII